MFLCNIVHYRIGLYFHHQSHQQLGIVFAFGCLFILSGLISPLFSSSILGTYLSGQLIFQCSIFLPFHTVHEVLKARILKWFATPFSTGPRFDRTLHHDLSILGGPTQHGSQFHWVRQARLWPMWLVWLVFCDCGFHSVCPLTNKDKRLMEASRCWRDWL